MVLPISFVTITFAAESMDGPRTLLRFFRRVRVEGVDPDSAPISGMVIEGDVRVIFLIVGSSVDVAVDMPIYSA